MPPSSTKTRRRKVGRPSKLTPRIRQTVARLVEQGCFLEDAARAAGVSVRTARDWLQRGEARHPSRKADWPTVKFRRAVRDAQRAFLGIPPRIAA
jgi:DNA invertase Pin-like site-specific DNA recombinase